MEIQSDLRITMPLSGRGKPILYWTDAEGLYWLQWGNISFMVNKEQVDKILREFFREKLKWYPLGASMTKPVTGGLGEYIQEQFPPFGPRHASAIAAMMVNERWLVAQGKNPIKLSRIIPV